VRASSVSPAREQRSLRLLPGPSALARDVAYFLLDRQARGLSPRIVDFHAERLRHLTRWPEGQPVVHVEDLTADHLCSWLVLAAKHAALRTLWVATQCAPKQARALRAPMWLRQGLDSPRSGCRLTLTVVPARAVSPSDSVDARGPRRSCVRHRCSLDQPMQ
jgi:hypothetical protein